MQIAIINDTHFGVKNSSDVFLDYQEKFFRDVFFPYCVKHGIKQVIHIGDLFDNRKFLPIKALQRTRQFFFEPLKTHGMYMHIIPGNHDVAYKNTNSLNALEEVLPRFPNVQLIMEPEELQCGDLDIAVVPWINAENYADTMAFINGTKAPFLMGHFELAGFEMMKGAPVTSHGMDGKELFGRFQTVLSGHYHTKSSKDNIHYLGTQYELTWADCDDAKFFHVLDTSDRSVTPIRNSHCIFNKVLYDDADLDDPRQAVADWDPSAYANTFVKVIVVSKKDPVAFDKFIDKLQDANPFDFKILESLSEFTADCISDDEISLEDTPTLLDSYIDAVDTNLSKDKLKSLIQGLYVEAQEMDAA